MKRLLAVTTLLVLPLPALAQSAACAEKHAADRCAAQGNTWNAETKACVVIPTS